MAEAIALRINERAKSFSVWTEFGGDGVVALELTL
jgi:hypothetical protein